MANARIRRIRFRRRHSGAVLLSSLKRNPTIRLALKPPQPDHRNRKIYRRKRLPPLPPRRRQRRRRNPLRRSPETRTHRPLGGSETIRWENLGLNIPTWPISHRATSGAGGIMAAGGVTMEGGGKWIRAHNTGTARTGPTCRRRHRATATLPRSILNTATRPAQNPPRSHVESNRPPFNRDDTTGPIGHIQYGRNSLSIIHPGSTGHCPRKNPKRGSYISRRRGS